MLFYYSFHTSQVQGLKISQNIWNCQSQDIKFVFLPLFIPWIGRYRNCESSQSASSHCLGLRACRSSIFTIGLKFFPNILFFANLGLLFLVVLFIDVILFFSFIVMWCDHTLAVLMLVSPSLCFSVGLHQGEVGGSFHFSMSDPAHLMREISSIPWKVPQNTKCHQTAYLTYSTDNIKMFPVVLKLSVKLNTPLPASATCDRLFSIAGLIFSPTRARLAVNTFKNQLMLRMNRKFNFSINVWTRTRMFVCGMSMLQPMRIPPTCFKSGKVVLKLNFAIQFVQDIVQ